MVTSKFLIDSHYQNFNFYNFEPSSSLARHRWYYFKEGFSASLINEAVERQGEGRKLNILDPFCGCGTTPLQAALLKHKSTAIEVNPFLAFTAKAKTNVNKWNKNEFITLVDEIITCSIKGKKSKLEEFSTFTKKEGLDKWLFNIDVLRRYSSVIFEIENRAQKKYLENLKLAAIIAAFECSNARRDGKGLRYKNNWSIKQYNSDTFIERFRNRCSIMLEDMTKSVIEKDYKPNIIHGDSREKISKLENDSFDLIITSPPYLNSFDYSDIYRAELFLGEFVNSHEELRSLRKNTLRSHVQVKWEKPIEFIPGMLTSINQDLNEKKEHLWDKNIPYMVKAYFDDMQTIFKEAFEKLKKGGELWLVVSTSAYAGIHIPVDFILGEIFSHIGFELDSIHFLRNLRSSSQQWKTLHKGYPPLRESLVIARKN